MAQAARGNFFDIDGLINRLLPRSSKVEAAESCFLAPRVNIKELKDRYEITMELPGVNKNDLIIALEDGLLTISAETKKEDEDGQEGKIIRQERRSGKFMRSFTLGDSVLESDISASVTDGILKVNAPKALTGEEKPQKRLIKVN